MVLTFSEKVLMRASGEKEVTPGQIVDAAVDTAMSHENAGLVSKKFKTIGVPKVWNPDEIVLLFDHRVPANIEKTAIGQKAVREFVKEQGIKNFYDMKAGICHQIMVEKGHVAPGKLIVGTDSHTTSYGALGAFSSGIGATEMATVWATGRLWLKVPETIKINVTGKLPDMVFSKDLILKIIGDHGADHADYKSIEFYGETIEDMTIASRIVMSNQAMEMGAKAAIVPPDEKTFDYVDARVDYEYSAVYADGDADYEEVLDYDVTDLEPQIACPHAVDNVKPISEVEGTPVQQAFLGSCTNGRIEDLKVAADILKGKKIHEDVRLIIIPASWEVYLDAMDMGILKTLIEADGVVCNPGCGPCLGAHQGILAPGEAAIASTNRNFKGRMGSTEASVYLSSPATVAASALTGKITDPREVLE